MLPFRKVVPRKPANDPDAVEGLREALVHCLDLITRSVPATSIPLETQVRLRRLKMAASSARGSIELGAISVDICGLHLPTREPSNPGVDSVVAGAAQAAEEVSDAAAVPGLSMELRRLAAMPAPSPLPSALAEFGAEMHKLRDVVRFLRERGDILSSTATGMAEYLGGLSEAGEGVLSTLNQNKRSIASATSVEDLQTVQAALLSSVEDLIRDAEARIQEGKSAKELVEMHNAHKTLLEAALANAKEMANGDALTGLGNERALDAMVRSGAVEGGTVGVIALSMDGLSRRRENKGREATSAIVQQFARVLKGELSVDAQAFRIDGDTFVLMLPNHNLAAATKIAQNLQARFAAAPLRALGRDFQQRLSLGVSAWTAGKAFREVFAKADKLRAMIAKKGGDAVRAQAA